MSSLSENSSASQLFSSDNPLELNSSALPISGVQSDLTTDLSQQNARISTNSSNSALNFSSEFAPGQLIVKVKAGIADDSINSIKSLLSVSATKSLGITGAEVWQLKEIDVASAIEAYAKDSRFAYFEPNFKVSAAVTPNDPSFSQLWGLNNTGQTIGGQVGTPDADIDAPEAWNIQTGNNVLVGVIDSGVDYTHPDLAANIWTNPGEIAGDGLDNDANGFIDDIRGYDFINNDANPMDDNNHGTHVSGTIAGRGNNGVGITGVSWSAKIMALKFLGADGSGFISDAIRATNYATQMGAKLTNNSWGGGGFSQGMLDAITAARNAGSLFVAAAGNNGTDNDVTAHYPSSYNVDNVIAVAASDNRDALASFSNFGFTTVDLGAPGVNILSTTPGNTYSSFSGTSMATPHVAGAASLVWAQNPTMTYAQVKSRLLSTGDAIAALQGKTVTGRRLNALNALTGTAPNTPGIYGSVWNDANANGIRNPGEAGLGNWTVYVDSNINGKLDTALPGTTVNSINVPKSIADLSTVNSTLAVSGFSGTIKDLNVKLNISHTFDADLDVFLISPLGTRIELFTDVGSSGVNFTNTILDDEATTSIASGTAPFTGRFKSEGLLSGVDGQNPNGSWRLETTDDASGDVGTLNSWSLTFNSAAKELSKVTSASGAYSFTNLASGTYAIREVLKSGWSRTAPSTGLYSVAYTSGTVVNNRDFGNKSLTAASNNTAFNDGVTETIDMKVVSNSRRNNSRRLGKKSMKALLSRVG